MRETQRERTNETYIKERERDPIPPITKERTHFARHTTYSNNDEITYQSSKTR